MVASEVAKDLNRRIYEVAMRFVVPGEMVTLQFFCECGCLEQIMLSPEEYNQSGGAWVEGHREQPRPSAEDRH